MKPTVKQTKGPSLRPSQRARALPALWRPQLPVVYKKPSPPAVLLVGGGLIAGTISVLAFLTPIVSTWALAPPVDAYAVSTKPVSSLRTPVIPGASYQPRAAQVSSPPDVRPTALVAASAVSGSAFHPSNAGSAYGASGSILTPAPDNQAYSTLQNQVQQQQQLLEEDHTLITLLAQHVLGANSTQPAPQPLMVPGTNQPAGSAATSNTVSPLPPPPVTSPQVSQPPQVTSPTLYPAVQADSADASPQTITPGGSSSVPTAAYTGPWPGWTLNGVSSGQIMIGDAAGDLRVMHVGDSFMSVRLLSVDTRTGVATTSAGELHIASSLQQAPGK